MLAPYYSSRGGPDRVSFTYINPTTAVYIGLTFKGTAVATITKLPVRIPALPKPAIARPIIRAGEDGANPLMVDPISKTNIDMR